jgi:hypothetical protein
MAVPRRRRLGGLTRSTRRALERMPAPFCGWPTSCSPAKTLSRRFVRHSSECYGGRAALGRAALQATWRRREWIQTRFAELPAERASVCRRAPATGTCPKRHSSACCYCEQGKCDRKHRHYTGSFAGTSLGRIDLAPPHAKVRLDRCDHQRHGPERDEHHVARHAHPFEPVRTFAGVRRRWSGAARNRAGQHDLRSLPNSPLTRCQAPRGAACPPPPRARHGRRAGRKIKGDRNC